MKKQAQKYGVAALDAVMPLARLFDKLDKMDADLKATFGAAGKGLLHAYLIRRSLRRLVGVPARLRDGESLDKKDASAIITLLTSGTYIVVTNAEFAREEIAEAMRAKGRLSAKSKSAAVTGAPDADALAEAIKELEGLGLDPAIVNVQTVDDLFSALFQPKTGPEEGPTT